VDRCHGRAAQARDSEDAGSFMLPTPPCAERLICGYRLR
jgi:hypothetical protein